MSSKSVLVIVVVSLLPGAARAQAGDPEPQGGASAAQEPSGSDGGEAPASEADEPARDEERTPLPCDSAPAEMVSWEQCGAHCFRMAELHVGGIVWQVEVSLDAKLTCTTDRVRFDHWGGVEMTATAGYLGSLAPETRQRLAAMERAKPGGKDALEAAAALATGLRALATANSSVGQSAPPTIVTRDELARAAIVYAREAFAAGDWVTARANAAEQRTVQPVAPAAERLLAEIAKAEAATMPLAASGWRRIGAVTTPPVLPPEYEATVFWRGAALCVGQEDGKGEMRCYDPDARKWGPRERFARPSDGLVDGYAGYACLYESFWVIASRASAEETRTGNFCGHFPKRPPPLAMGPGPTFVFEGAHGLVASRGDGESELSAAAATALVSTSAGAHLAGGGTLVLTETLGVRRAGDAKKEWRVAPPNPPEKDRAWASLSPLASPDQRWALFVAGPREPGSKGYALWLARLGAPRK